MRKATTWVATIAAALALCVPLQAQEEPEGWDQGVAAFTLMFDATEFDMAGDNYLFTGRLVGIDGAPRAAITASGWRTPFNIGIPPGLKCADQSLPPNLARRFANSGGRLVVTGTPDGFRRGVAQSVSFETPTGLKCLAGESRLRTVNGSDWMKPS